MSYEERPGTNRAAPAPMDDEPALKALLLYPDDWALFLDIDGTLIDLAETPNSVIVPPALPLALDTLSRKIGGALALVTGRAVSFIDPLFHPFHFPVAGLHGAERRDAGGLLQYVRTTPAFEAMKQRIKDEAAPWPGILIEDKGAAIAAHYRLAPDRQYEVEAMMERYFQEAGLDWTLQRGKMVIEIRPAAASKGHAVEAFLSERPFAGRRPIAIGYDITDEAMFDAANRLGGHSIRIGPPAEMTHAASVIASPAELRGMIGMLAS